MILIALIFTQIASAAEPVVVDSAESIPLTKVTDLKKIHFCDWPEVVLIKRTTDANYYWSSQNKGRCRPNQDTTELIKSFEKAQAQLEEKIMPPLMARNRKLSKVLPFWNETTKQIKILDVIIQPGKSGSGGGGGDRYPLTVNTLDGREFKLATSALILLGAQDNPDAFTGMTLHEVGHTYARFQNPVFLDDTNAFESCLHPLTEVMADFNFLSIADFNPQKYADFRGPNMKGPDEEKKAALEGNETWRNNRQYEPFSRSKRTLPEAYYDQTDVHTTGHIFSYLAYRLAQVVPHDLLTTTFYQMVHDDPPAMHDPNLARFSDELSKRILAKRPDLDQSVHQILAETKWTSTTTKVNKPLVGNWETVEGKRRLYLKGLAFTKNQMPNLTIKNDISYAIEYQGKAKGWACEGFPQNHQPPLYRASYFQFQPVNDCDKIDDSNSCICPKAEETISIRGVFLNKERMVTETESQKITLPSDLVGKCLAISSQIDTSRRITAPTAPRNKKAKTTITVVQ